VVSHFQRKKGSRPRRSSVKKTWPYKINRLEDLRKLHSSLILLSRVKKCNERVEICNENAGDLKRTKNFSWET
jgi:hypothetical protein